MDVVSACPLPVASLVWRPGSGGWALTVVCRATFVLAPGRSPLAHEQPPPFEADVPWDGDPRRSLHAPSDLVPFKRRADVLVVGHAFAPGGLPARSLVARVQIAELDKAIEVHCDRAFAQDGSLVEGPRFPSMPLVWERAAGGPDTLNPVGMRFDAAPDHYGRIPIPNLQPPRRRIAARGDTFAPIGFGPFAPSWPRRVHMLHRHAAGWSHARWFDRALPEDVGPGYFNAAPPDQQIDALPAGMELTLEHLHHEHPLLVTRLAPVFPRATVERPGGTKESIVLACDTLWIDTDRGVAALVWRGTVRLSHASDRGRVVIGAEGQGIADLVRSGVIDVPAVAEVAEVEPVEVEEIEAADDIDDEETQQPEADDDAPTHVSDELLAGSDLDDAPTPPGPVKHRRIPTMVSPPDAPKADPLPFRLADASRTPGASSLARTALGALHGGGALKATRTLPLPARADPPAETPFRTTDTMPLPRSADPPAATPFRARDTMPLAAQESTGVIRPDDLKRKGPTLPFGKPGVDRAAAARAMLGAPPPRPIEPPLPIEESTALVDLTALERQPAALPFAPAQDELDGETQTDGPATLQIPKQSDTTPPPLSMTATELPALPSVDLPFVRDAAFEPLPSLARVPVAQPAWSPAQEAAASAARAKIEPEAPPLSVEDYASVKMAFWSKTAGSHASVEDTLRELGVDEDTWRAGEERLLGQLAEEAGRGETRLARAVRAAMKRALGAARSQRSPGLPSLRAG